MNPSPVQLGGTAEVAAALGCPKQQLAKLRQRADFPIPVVMLAATPVWDLQEVRSFADRWVRRKNLDRMSA